MLGLRQHHYNFWSWQPKWWPFLVLFEKCMMVIIVSDSDSWWRPFLAFFRSARTSCRTFDLPVPSRPTTNFPEFIDEPQHCRQASGTPQTVFFWKLMMSAIQIWTKIQIQRQIHGQILRQIQIKEKLMTPMMSHIFENEMTKGFWIWYGTGNI